MLTGWFVGRGMVAVVIHWCHGHSLVAFLYLLILLPPASFLPRLSLVWVFSGAGFSLLAFSWQWDLLLPLPCGGLLLVVAGCGCLRNEVWARWL